MHEEKPIVDTDARTTYHVRYNLMNHVNLVVLSAVLLRGRNRARPKVCPRVRFY